MDSFCRKQITKFYIACAALGITTILKATYLTQFSARPVVSIIGKEDHLLGQFQINLKHVMRDEDGKNVPIFVKLEDSRVYLFSAIIVYYNELHKDQTTLVGPTAILSGWELRKDSAPNSTCCFTLKDGSIVSEMSFSKPNWWYLQKAKLQAKQFKCPIHLKVSDIKTISIAYNNSTCPTKDKFSIPPTVVERKVKNQKSKSTKIAVCVKLAYGSLNARMLVEWFEVHRLFGVDKVIAYKYHLNTNASRVLEFYENDGFAEVFDYDIPEKELIERDVGDETVQYWNDEQIAVFDCQERLRNYDYVAVVDTDEFIIPTTNRFKNSWKIFMEQKFRKSNYAGLVLSVRVHADTWGPTNANHPLHIGRYKNCTLPMLDSRPKGVYMPARVQQGTVATHSFVPLRGYRRCDVKASEATVHHFRKCRKEWLEPFLVKTHTKNKHLYYKTNTTKCFDFIRTQSKLTEQLANTVKDSVLMRITEIGV